MEDEERFTTFPEEITKPDYDSSLEAEEEYMADDIKLHFDTVAKDLEKNKVTG